MTRLGLAVVVALLPVLPVAAQPSGKVYRIALASPSTSVAEMSDHGRPSFKAFFSELRRLGYVEGKNLLVERRSAEGRIEREPDIVAEIVHLKPDLIVAFPGRLVQRLKTATTVIPIVAVTEGSAANPKPRHILNFRCQRM
jgi:putative tryptophan/tyrosine transport system substrate-binding protein